MNSLIINNKIDSFYNHLIKLLESCDSFVFNVAFINFSGVQLLLDSLEKLERRGVKGKILTSTYLNFTQIKALEKLKNFTNIELKIYDSNVTKIGFHSKAYIFEFKDEYKLLIGSSNITSSAFKKNIEWNVKHISSKNSPFFQELFSEFELLWNEAFDVNEKFLISYEKHLNSLQNIQNTQNFIFKKDIKPNFMQKNALDRLEFLRKNREKKALIISATGTGKTYLASFDVENFNPKRVLFLVHRENILISAKNSFENILPNRSCGLFTGNKKEKNSDFLFATIQTMNLYQEEFSKQEFDYIIIDEAHHCVTPSYKKVLDYFEPKFLLGLTATSNRMDGESIYEIFDENIACDIRLNDALDEDLVVPFHYFGISDICVDYENLDLTKIDEIANALQINKRVDFVIEKMDFYNHCFGKRKVLGFCVSKEHAFFMSEEFNKRGINSVCLTSEDSILKREESIKKLEDENDSLEVIFTIDIFNEGVDIPSLNMVLFLRPTNSAIVFTQQLGRGLRKQKNKEFLTVLDFIGNHKKAYLIALALAGNRALDKDSIKSFVKNDFASFQNIFIKMDEISKQTILEQLEKQNFNSIKYLKEQYFEFKNIIGKTPKLSDFLPFDDVINPLNFIDESKSYIEFLAKVEDKNELKVLCKNDDFIKAIRFIENMLPIKRVYEFVILKHLFSHKNCSLEDAFFSLQKYQDEVCKNTIIHSFRYLDEEFFDKAQKDRYLKLVDFDGKELIKSEAFQKLLENEKYKEIFEDSLNYGIYLYEKEFGVINYGMPFLRLYGKYNMLNIAQLCNFPKIHSSFRGSGFLKYQNDFFLFINLEKEKFSKSANYQNAFLSQNQITYQSKPNMSQSKSDGQRLCENKKYGVKLHLFVRKFVQIDKKTQDFIYLGLSNSLKFEGNNPISLVLELEEKVNDILFEEFTK